MPKARTKAANARHDEVVGDRILDTLPPDELLSDGVWYNLKDDHHVVVWHGSILSPKFNSKGAAQAYMDALRAGTRQPEFRKTGH